MRQQARPEPGPHLDRGPSPGATMRPMSGHLRVLGLVVAGGLAALGSSGFAADGYEHDSPHGAKDRCTACHAPASGGKLAGAVLPVVATCRGCHPTADMHPVDVKPHDVPVPDGFPLHDGIMVCSTCHQEPAHRHVPGLARQTPELESPWHRGGPYPNTLAFCNACHEPSKLARENPHHGTNPPDPTADTCTTCHTTAPQRGASVADAKLRLSPPAVCSSCHSTAPHAGAAEHFGQLVPPGVDLPSHEGRIVCFTCHDVHGGGAAGDVHSKLADALTKVALAGEWSGAADGVTLPGSDRPRPPMLAAPLQDGKLCRICHGEGP